jgi:hypothetical protein
MDTSKEYIKMCEKATEIQDLWDKSDNSENFGDFYFPSIKDNHEQKVRCVDYEFPYPAFSTEGLIWLPRQGQLQEMCEIDKYESERLPKALALLDTMITHFHEGWWDGGWNPSKYACSFTSMEQLWLAFVMGQKYGKTWNRNEWIDLEEK